MRSFRNRTDAGRQLAERLATLDFNEPIVLGIPRGGVVVSREIAQRLGAEHGAIVARKLGAPYMPELAIGAVASTGTYHLDVDLVHELGVDDHYINAELSHQMEEAKRREEQFDGRRHSSLAGRDVIVADDGVATGATAVAALRSARAQGARRVVFAVPVGPPQTIEELKAIADDVVCLEVEPRFFAVGQFYENFEPVEDQDVIRILDAAQAGVHSRSDRAGSPP